MLKGGGGLACGRRLRAQATPDVEHLLSNIEGRAA
jgi:hypothetical protein